MKAKGAELHVGPAGWSYKDWEGIVYPDPKPKGFRAPTFLARHFNAIELNNTFYRPPQPGYCHRWVKDVAGRDDFLYTAKLWRRFTHEREERWSDEDVRVFREGIAPLVEADRLGALLVQFPWSFRYSAHSEQYLGAVVEEFSDLPLVIEVRSRAWVQERALKFIESLGVGFCNIDQPAFRGNIPLTSHAFGPVGYLRLHGRNYETWFAEEAGRDERYDYLYRDEELDELQAAIEEIAEQVERMFVIANNHYRGQAVATGLQLIGRLSGQETESPGRVGELYGLT
ncbi:MAG: DUF72 domain-containing protein [Planctomycetota bacterium]|jgi:uncharacterized protein YecE (DUF72 family)